MNTIKEKTDRFCEICDHITRSIFDEPCRHCIHSNNGLRVKGEFLQVSKKEIK